MSHADYGLCVLSPTSEYAVRESHEYKLGGQAIAGADATSKLAGG